ncbi:MAG: hypothetical protein IKC48_03130 [Clostridia bacterium]|nr:hypothetical protein [Clostridia bacterium]
MKKIVSFILVALLLFTLVGCNQNEQMDEMEKKIAQLEQALQNQADVNDELSAELQEQKSANEWLGQLILTQQGLIDKQQETIDDQRAEIESMKGAIDNISGKPIQFTESAPVYDERENDKTICYFGNLPTFSWEEPYEDFLNYYQSTYDSNTNGRLFILSPENDSNETLQDFFIKTQSEEMPYEKPMTVEYVNIFDVTLGFFNRYSGEGEGNFAPSVEIAFYAPAVSNEVAEQFDRTKVFLKFGNNATKGWNEGNYYFNIYMPIEGEGVTSNVCIGTCHYDVCANLSVEWFERFIYRNLFLGD